MLKKEVYDKLTAFSESELKLLNKDIDKENDIKEDFVINYRPWHRGQMFDIKRHTRFSVFPKHRHDYIEITYVFRGKMTQKIKNKEIVVQKGELIFLNQKIVHEIGMTSEEDIILNFLIRPEFFDYLFNLLDKENIISKFLLSTIYNSSVQGEYLCFHVSEIIDIQEIIEKIIEEIYQEKPMKNIKVQLLMGMLITELLNNSNFIESYSEENYDTKLIMNVLKYIDEEYRTANLVEISNKLNQPNYKISKVVKEATGLTFIELLQEKRLEKASELLKNTSLSIEDIIKDVGYENATYFYKIFKNKFDMSLKQYRKINN